MEAALSDLELEILHDVPIAGRLQPRAYVVWTNRDGETEMGPVQYRSARGERDRERTGDSSAWEYSCSPFPGAWDDHVTETQIRRVRHLGALSLHNMTCVCRGTEWDAPCPASDCTTHARV